MPLTEFTIGQMALSRLGHTIELTDVDGTVASLDGDEPNVFKAILQLQLWYEQAVGIVSRDFGFGRALKYATLTEASDGTGEVWEDIWEIAFDYPADCASFEGFVFASVPISQTWSEWLPVEGATWIIGMHDDSRVIFANGADDTTVANYRVTLADPLELDRDVADAVAWKLAQLIAPGLLGFGDGKNAATTCEANYEVSLSKASRASGREMEGPEPPFRGNWNASRA